MYKYFLKRALDVLISFLAIAILLIPMLIIALVVRIDTGAPAIFKQKRVGKNKKPFYILKFRTMKADAPSDTPTSSISDSERWISGVGRALRSTGLDELPQMFNILVGHMSFVGPRPIIFGEEELIAERDKNGVNGIRPGLTGWAQINGREKISVNEKARFDGEYVKKLNGNLFSGIFMDVRCVLGTVPVIIVSFLERGKAKENTDKRSL